MKAIRSGVIGLVALSFSGCCGGGGGNKAETSAVPVAKKSDMKMADPAAVKAVKKVAIVSITSTCDVNDMTEQKQSGTGKGSVFGALHSVKTMKNIDATRSPASLEVGIPQFMEEFAKGTGWTFVPLAEITANPAYEANTFPIDLREQVKATRMAWCTAGGYRVLTDMHTPRAGELAKALGVDAVALVHLDLTIHNWYDPRMGKMGSASSQFHTLADGRLTLVNAAGEVLYTETVRKIQNTDDVKFMGFNEKGEGVRVIVGVDWDKVPKNAGNTMKNAGIQMSAAVKKAQGT